MLTFNQHVFLIIIKKFLTKLFYYLILLFLEFLSIFSINSL